MKTLNKVHLIVQKDDYNNWFVHTNKPSIVSPYRYKLQLKGDTRIGDTFLEQTAKQCGLDNFMNDFDKILRYAEENHVALFTLYIKK